MTRYAIFVDLAAALVVAFVGPADLFAQAAGAIQGGQQQAVAQLYVTMHSAPIDDYCAPCITSERLLKEANVTYRKILEPMGPWPWFKLTDQAGNQRTIHGGLSQADVDAIKNGQWPQRR